MMKRLMMGLVAAATVGAGLMTPAAAETAPGLPAGYLHALQRDLGLTAVEAERRVAQEDAAIQLQAALVPRLGKAFAGSWFDPATGELTVAVTDRAVVGGARRAGANVAVVSRDLAALDAIKAEFDSLGVAAGVVATRVDPKSNSVVVTTVGTATGAVAATAARHGGAVRTEQTATPPRFLKEWLEGGERFDTNRTTCSIGFNAFDRSHREVMITAGHCGASGPITGWNGTQIGVFESIRFGDGNDYAIATTDSRNWIVDGVVSTDGPSGDTGLLVGGSAVAPVGASVCKSGITTGWTCGVITGTNETVLDYIHLEQVHGLTRTNVCAAGGDSGGSVMSGTQAQGVTSMGSFPACSGPMWFQPVGEILVNEGLTLMIPA